MRLTTMLLAAAVLLSPALRPAASRADEVVVVSSGGFAEAYKDLSAEFEHATGHKLVSQWGPSMGTTANAVPQRIARGEPIDVVIMVGYALGKLVEEGKAGDRADLANSGISMAVRQGAPIPDIATKEKLKAVLLAAPSIAYSDSASGVYIQSEMFKKMGIEDQVRGKARMIPADPVGGVVARGDVAVGFQQTSELKPIQGITIVGPLPPGLQLNTVFSAGVMTDAPHKEAARALVRFLASAKAAQAIRQSGMDPIAGKGS